MTNYRIEAHIEKNIRIVQLTDLHNSEFGENNCRLVASVSQQNPDLILITGDLLNSDENKTEVAVSLIKQLCIIAPVYFSYGNHETDFESLYGENLKSHFEEAGATVLDFSWQDITVDGQNLRIGGLFGYCMPEKYLESNEAVQAECDFLNKFQDTDLYTILLCHMPYCWIQMNGLNEWNADCIFSGHTHGGQIRVPFVGGLWAPDQGWFPGNEAGLYYSDDNSKVMILSRGLGSTEKIPRFNNVPEIVVMDIVPVRNN